LYTTNCAYCHGEDARGGENGGTNILRADVLMRDKFGELLAPFLRDGLSEPAGHKFTFTADQAREVAEFIHNFGMNSRDPGRMRPPDVAVGNAQAGETYFGAHCGSCHKATGDMKGIATRITNIRQLQQTWLMPALYNSRGGGQMLGANVPPLTVTVTPPGGAKVDGRLIRLDDFIVTLTTADGTQRTFRRDGGEPKVEVHNPLQGHLNLLPQYADADIHNVTAYLATLK
jgi:cytochrome c oxidase cbb3-type subunit III